VCLARDGTRGRLLLGRALGPWSHRPVSAPGLGRGADGADSSLPVDQMAGGVNWGPSRSPDPTLVRVYQADRELDGILLRYPQASTSAAAHARRTTQPAPTSRVYGSTTGEARPS